MRPAFSLGEAALASPYPSLASALLAGVEQFPDGGFLYLGHAGQARECGYRDTLDQALRVVAGLRDRGLVAGDPLLIGLADPADTVVALWAAILGGFVAIPAAPASGPGAGGLSDSERLALLQDVFGGGYLLVEQAAEVPNAGSSVLDFDSLLDAAPAALAGLPRADGDALRFAILTSGTTARPRLVGLSDQASLARWWPQMPDAAHARGFLSWTAFGHVMGVGLAMPNLPRKAHLDAGRFVAAPLSWLDALEASGATHATMTNFGMSLVLKAVAAHPARRWRLEHVRKIGIGAEAISRTTCEAFLACMAGFGLRDDALILGYGLSECGPVVGGSISFAAAGDGAEPGDAPPELDRPTRGHAVRIVGDNGYLLREGEVGRIEVRGPTMTRGYLGDDAASAALFTSDGWLRTGDLGLLRDGRLTVVGREKELVVVNARKYSCESIEAAIRAGTGLADVHAAPFEGTVAAGAPCAVFVAGDAALARAPGPVADAVRAACAEAFRFSPAVVVLIAHHEVPRTSLGKVRRLALAARLADPDFAARAQWLLAGAGTAALPEAGGNGAEQRIAGIWRELLGIEGDIDRHADFFALGGDSLLALRLSFMLEGEFGVPLQLDAFPQRLDIATLARVLAGEGNAPPDGRGPTAAEGALPDWLLERLAGFLADWPGTPVVAGGFVRRVGEGSQGVPLFFCVQHAEEALSVARTLGPDLPAYVMRSGMWLLNYDTPAAAALVDRYLAELRVACPAGPVMLGGTCQGVHIALAMTRRLVAEGREVRLLVAADCRFAEICEAEPVPVPVALFGAVGSKFNPYRLFRHPEAGLRKLAPRGLRLAMVDTAYATIMLAPAIDRLVQELAAAIAWADDRPPAPAVTVVPSRPAAYRRRLSSPLKSLELVPGERLSLPVRLKNTSPAAWEPFEWSGLAVGNHWLGADGGMLVWADGRAPLPRRLAPGERAYLALDIVAPAVPGQYLLEVDLVEEGICWFADFALAPLQIPVQVQVRAGGPAEHAAPARPRHAVLAALFRLADRQSLLTRASRRRPPG